MLYLPARVSLTILTRSGTAYGDRLLPQPVFCFRLSWTIASLFSLASTNWQHELADLQVVSASITAEESPGVTTCYQSPVRLRFYRLSFQRQDFGQRP